MRARASIAAAGVAALLGGCRSPTQISVDVSTNVACTDWQGTAISVGQLGPGLETKPATTTSTYCNDAGYLGTVVAIPSGGENEAVAFRVVGAVGESLEQCTGDAASSGCIVARRALNFIPHTSLTLSIPLAAACAGILCDPTTTCVEGICRPATIPDPGGCANATCGEGALGDGGAVDATVGDSGGDGGDAGVREGGPLADGSALDATMAGDSGADADGGTAPDAGQAATCGESCALSLAEKATCITQSGGVVCWGQNDLGDLGRNNQTSPGTPGPVLAKGGGALTGVEGIVSGFDTLCAFLAGGVVSCWGAGEPLQLDGGASDLAGTIQPALAGASAVSIGQYHLCWQHGAALTCSAIGSHEIGSFGDAEDAGDATPVTFTLPAPAGSAGPFVQLSTTQFFTCVLDGSGRVFCIGSNDSNEVDPSPQSANGILTSFVNVVMPNAQPVLELGLMSATACARTAGHVFCWGNDGYADSRGGGDGQNEPNEVFLDDGGPIDAVRLAPGEYHSCALLTSAQVVCWGDNQYHELGRGESATADAGDSELARLVLFPDGGTFGGVTSLASGGYHTCATTSDGSLWCWGDNRDGETAPGDTVSRSSPTRVSY